VNISRKNDLSARARKSEYSKVYEFSKAKKTKLMKKKESEEETKQKKKIFLREQERTCLL
jgi:hypothetical protein